MRVGNHTYTLICSHFGDPFWITHRLNQVDRQSDHRVERVVVVDQSRESSSVLSQLPRVESVLTFPPDSDQMELLGHDHPAALNRAIEVTDCETSHIMILDSDCFPLNSSWLDLLDNVTLARDPAKWGLSHPCFVSFPSGLGSVVDFAEGLREVGMDTGRLLGLQIERSGTRVNFTHPQAAFRGIQGHYYLERSLFHFGSASFGSSLDPRLSGRYSHYRNALFRRKIANGDYCISLGERILLRLALTLESKVKSVHD